MSGSSSSLSSSTTTTPEVVSSSSVDNILILSPSRLINGQQNHINVGLPPPETPNESIKTKKAKFGRKKKMESQNDATKIPYPPKFIQMNDRSLSFGDNSFDIDNTAYNLYAFVVRITDFNDEFLHIFFSYSVIME